MRPVTDTAEYEEKLHMTTIDLAVTRCVDRKSCLAGKPEEDAINI